MMANNVKKNPIVVMSQINPTSTYSRCSSTSVSAESKSPATISSSSTQNHVPIGELQCCGKWFSSSKSFHRHLVDAAQTDPQHESKLFQIGMRRCSLCPMWVHKNAMTQHIKRNHTTKIASNNSSTDPTVNKIQGQQHQGGFVNRVPIPNVRQNDQLPGSLGSKGAPGYIIRVSGQPQQFVRVGLPAQPINRAAGVNTVKTPNTVHKAQFKGASRSMLPTSLANTIITDKNGATLGYKVGGTQFVTKKTISADGVQKLTIGTLGSVRKILPVAKGAELQKQARSALPNSAGNQDNKIISSPISKGDGFSPLAHNSKNNIKTYKGTIPSTQTIRKNVTGTNISYTVLERPSGSVEIASPVEPNIGTSANKIISKKKRKQVLSPSLESVDTVTLDKDTAVGVPMKVKEIKRPPKKQKTSPASLDNSMNQIDNVTPKNQKKNSRGSKSTSNKNNDSSYTPVATSSGRGRGRKKAPGRPGRPRRIVMENPEPNESDSFLVKDDENIENEPEMDMKTFKVEENVPEVELDLFTLPSVSEKQFSVLLVEPKNPNFKVYASMDAIFVGDSALGDVTNQLGYITDMNNVVFVNPEHFLFPNVKDIDNFVPRPLLIMKCSKNMNLQSKTQANSNDNMKSPILKTQAVENIQADRDNQADKDIEVDKVTQEEEETRLIGRNQILRYLQGASPDKKPSGLKDSASANIVSPLNDTNQTEQKQTKLFSDVYNSNKDVNDHAASVKPKTTVTKETSPTPCENNLSDIKINLGNNSSKTHKMPSTFGSKTHATLEENIDVPRVENTSDKSNENSNTLVEENLASDQLFKEIKKDVSYKMLEKESKVEMNIDHSIKSHKEVLDLPRHSLINSPKTGLISTKLGLKIPKPATGLKQLDETGPCKGIDKSVENKKRVNELHIMPEPIKFSSPVVNKIGMEPVNMNMPKPNIGLKQKVENNDSKEVEKVVGNMKKLNDSQILPEPISSSSTDVNATYTEIVGKEIPKLITELKQLEGMDDSKGVDKLAEDKKKVNVSNSICKEVDKDDSKGVDKSVEDMKKVNVSNSISDQKYVDDSKSVDKSVEKIAKVNESNSVPEPVKSSPSVINDKNTEQVNEKSPKLVTGLKQMEENNYSEDVNKSFENMKRADEFQSHIMPDPVQSSSSIINPTKTELVGREISSPIMSDPVKSSSPDVNTSKTELLDRKILLPFMPKPVKLSSPVVNTTKTELVDKDISSPIIPEQVKSNSPVVNITKTELEVREISTPISGLKKLKDRKIPLAIMPEPDKSSSLVVNTTKTELKVRKISSPIMPEPVKSSSTVADPTNTELEVKKIPMSTPGVKQIDDMDVIKDVDKSGEKGKRANKLNVLPESNESSFPVVNIAKAETVDRNILGANSENDNTQIMTSLKQEQKNSETVSKDDKLIIPVIQNSQILSRKVLDNKIDESLKEPDVSSKSQILKIDNSDSKKPIKSLRAFRSKSIDSLSTIEKKLSEKDGKTDRADLPEKEIKSVSGTDRLQCLTHDEKLNTGSDQKVSSNSKVSIDSIKKDTLYSGKVERLEGSKFSEEKKTLEVLESKKKHENENQISKLVLPITDLKSFRSKNHENEASIPDDSKFDKLDSVPSDCKKNKFGSPPATNRDIRSFFQHTSHEESHKPVKKVKMLEKASPKTTIDAKGKMAKEPLKIEKEETTVEKTSAKDNSNSIKSQDGSSEKICKKEPSNSSSSSKSENTQEINNHSENLYGDSLDNAKEKKTSDIKIEKNISLKDNTSEALEIDSLNDRLSSPPTKNLVCKKNKTTDIRDFFSPEKGKKRTSLELNEKGTSLELCESFKKVKTEKESNDFQEDLEIKNSLKRKNLPSALKLNEADFLGFDGSLSISHQRSHLLSEIVNRLTLKHNIRKEEFEPPLDQMWDSDEQLISNRTSTSR